MRKGKQLLKNLRFVETKTVLMSKVRFDENSIKKLLAGKTVDQLATDPPYGVDYAKKNDYLNRFDRGNRIQKAYANDERKKDFVEFFSNFLKIILIYFVYELFSLI